MNPVSVAIKGKGPLNLLRRSMVIGGRYGITPGKLDRALARLAAALGQFGCSATFPITAVALRRSPHIVRRYQEQGIEFAIHGYRHLDYSQLSPAGQSDHLQLAREAFAQTGIQVSGYRSPYLRWNPDTVAALSQQGFSYDSSQALTWNVVGDHETPAYSRVVGFYGALPIDDYPSLPSLEDNLVRIPYSLPDDEALVERLDLKIAAEMSALWLAILRCTYELGELFTIGLHPERVNLCLEPLTDVLAEARSLTPPVWIARLDEIATWWRSRSGATYQLVQETENSYRLIVNGPVGTTLLARSVELDVPAMPWVDGYRRVLSNECVFRAHQLPLIGLSPDSPSALGSFLRQQGYLVEKGANAQACATYLKQTEFTSADERPLLAQLEEGTWPLLRLARWPGGAKSTLSVTGDIDALTVWDYGLRFLGN